MELMTFKETLSYLGFKSPQVLKKWIGQGLPVIVIGDTKRIKKSDVDKFVEDHTVTATLKD